MTDRELLQQSLDALRKSEWDTPHAVGKQRLLDDIIDRLAQQEAEPVAWQNAEEWESLAWELCADENGEDSCNELIWEGGPVPEPWGERWLKYEGEAKRLIALVRKHVATPQAQPAPAPMVPELETRADGKLVRIDRWEWGIRRIVALLWGNRKAFEVDEVVEAVRHLVPASNDDDESLCATVQNNYAAPAVPQPTPASGWVWQHRKGGEYTILGEGKIQCDVPPHDMAEVVLYRAEIDGTLWVRPESEFNERFKRLRPLAAPAVQPCTSKPVDGQKAPDLTHKPTVQRLMDLARRFRATPGDLYDGSYKELERACYVALSAVQPLTEEWIAQFCMDVSLGYTQTEAMVRHVEQAHGIGRAA